MLPTFKFICIPVDTRDPLTTPDTFSLKIVTTLQFPPDVTFSASQVRDITRQHPLLANPAEKRLTALVWDYRKLEANKYVMDRAAATHVTLTFSGRIAPEVALKNLSDYLGSSQRPVKPSAMEHDSRPELVTEDHFVDILKARDDLMVIRSSLQGPAVRRLTATDRFPPASTGTGLNDPRLTTDAAEIVANGTLLISGLGQWIDAALQSTIIDLVYPNSDIRSSPLAFAAGAYMSTIQSVKGALTKVERRMRIDGAAPSGACSSGVRPSGLFGVRSTGEQHELELGDPNVAVHSALKNALMAEVCGFVTEWSVNLPNSLRPGDYAIQLDTSALSVDRSKVDVNPSIPTAFRRALHTHPVSYVDIGSSRTRNSLLACLNESAGTPLYRATAVNAETALVKEVLLQGTNSLGSRNTADAPLNGPKSKAHIDTRSPQLLARQRFGRPEPETAGVVFSAPVSDLLLPSALRQFASPSDRDLKLPCHFLEDLWIGYRLDVRKEGRQRFTSIHAQRQHLTFAGSTNGINGSTEDFIDREQLDDPARGHTSTELTMFNGLSSGQAKDYLIVLGKEEPPRSHPGQPFTASITGYGRSERLLFGNIYEYRLRNVFLGGTGAKADDQHLDESRQFPDQHRQRFPFYRARSLRPGELLFSAQPDQARDAGGRTIYLTAHQPRQLIALVPTPLDLESSRFHGLFGMQENEVKRDKDRKHVADLGKFFTSIPPHKLNYYYDPDVYGIVVHAKVLNGSEREEPELLSYMNGTYCRVTKHLPLPPVTGLYGKKGHWRGFRPIVLTFETTTCLTAELGNAGLFNRCHHIKLRVPPAAEIDVSILPLCDLALLARTASASCSSEDLRRRGSVPDLTLPIPALAEQRIKVIHAIDRPRFSPRLICPNANVTGGSGARQEVSIGIRPLDSEFGRVVGRIELDAASTKEVQLQASWMDITDDAQESQYRLASGTASSKSRGVTFSEFQPMPATAHAFATYFADTEISRSRLSDFRVTGSEYTFEDQFELHCAENKVFLGNETDDRLGQASMYAAQPKSADSVDTINFGDQRRKLAQVQAVGINRFSDRFGRCIDARSRPSLVDVPSTVRLPPPAVSHVVPLRRVKLVEGRPSRKRLLSFGFRIYVRKPWFQSGPGERLAVGCSSNAGPVVSGSGESLKYITQWGEDPIERAGLESTKRRPRAADFVELPGADGSRVPQFAAELYPPSAMGGNRAVIYKDDIALPPTTPSEAPRLISIASYALRYDYSQKFWYADVYVASDFFGWCGLALYRHQPNAHPMRELSETWVWIYGAVLYGEPVAWVEAGGNIYLTIGPVYDASVSFELDSLQYQHFVSEDLSSLNRLFKPLQSYKVDRATYFEAILPQKGFRWNLLKKRFGHAQSSEPLWRE